MQLSPLYRLVAFCLFLLAATGPYVFAQDQENQQDQPDQEQTQSETTDAPVDSEGTEAEVTASEPQVETGRRTLYFLGPRVSFERQQGPSVGKPVSILPKPYVAVGSVAVPEPIAPESDALTDSASDQENIEEADEQGEFADVVDTADGDNQAEPFVTGDDLLNQDTLTDDGQEGANQPSDVFDPLALDGFSEGTLTRIDPSGLPVETGDEGLDTVWQGYDRNAIEAFLNVIARPSQSPTLASFASAIASSRFDLPAPEADSDVISLIEARLAVFQSQADRQAYVALIDSLPADRDWAPLARHFARAHLLKGQLPDACQIAETERANDQDPYWLRLSAFCQAAAGNRAGVDFQLGILEETTNVDQTFYQLIDQILVEAEQPPGTVLPPVVELEQPVPATILTASMMRLARVSVAEIDALNVNPLAVPLLLENPLLSRTAQNTLIEYLIARGVAEGEMVATFIRSLEIPDEELNAVRAWLAAQSDNAQPVSEEAAQIAEEDQTLFNAADLQAALLKLVFLQQADALPALDQYWQQSGERNQLPGVAPGLKSLISASNVSAALAAPDSVGIFARAALLAEDEGAAEAWARRLRISVAGEDADVDRALVALAPLLEADKWGAADDLVSVPESWLAQADGLNTRYREANLLFSMLDALDETVPAEVWAAIDDGPVLFEGGSVAPSVWRRYLVSLEAGDPVASLSMIYKIMAEVGPADLPPAMAGSIVRGLYQLGFEAAARALALEILISQKI